ncbi:hypothetical protein ALI22I_13275 [Saccharothrix sp. ALI-22-I]|uniref:DUF742 domain-containing protein n=1 Tax=Saccharothrix sp. ALI-22-I TaxID=1933778 RepID=UPI00097BB251|nr:DUF742 domain-containing protein [Saccharothrix sp. ALI-22-I]ONI90321.1 hypothetical protein ALI22I_13275 [Saccharothrix sp. ALI-22-I]
MDRNDEPAGSDETFAALLNGFSLDSNRRRKPPEQPKPEQPAATTRPHRPVFDDEDEFEYPREEAASIVRAYSWTGGRTTSSYQLEIETLVSAVEWDYPGGMKAEYHEVIALVGRPRSVAEVAALLRLPLGVAKVLLGDMAERGLIDVHRTATADGAQPDLGLMERVLSGLRRL